MIRQQFTRGKGETFPFRITENGSYVNLSSYSIDFIGRTELSAISYHLSWNSATPTQIDVPFSVLCPNSAHVSRGTFDIMPSSGDFEFSEVIQIVARDR
jgi:hypothetical protein